MSIENKAKELVAQLLGENDYGDDSLLSDVLYGDPFGEGIVVLSFQDPDDEEPFIVAKPSRDYQYIYTSGYNGGDSRSYDIAIESPKPLREFDDFYGKTSKYPVVARISKALDDAGIRNLMGGSFLDGMAAGMLKVAAIPPAEHGVGDEDVGDEDVGDADPMWVEEPEDFG